MWLCNRSDELCLMLVTGSKSSIFVRNKSRSYTVRSKSLAFLAHRKDLRFSMKMMFAVGYVAL